MNRALVILGFAFVIGCSRHVKPSAFSFRVADAFEHAYHIETCDDVVCYSAYQPNPAGEKGVQPIRLRPTDRQWIEFRRNLDKAGVWQWKATYDAPVLDGWGYELKVSYPDRHIQSFGANNAPETFDAVFAAVEKLVGKHIVVDR
jgi:hypothetical protein